MITVFILPEEQKEFDAAMKKKEQKHLWKDGIDRMVIFTGEDLPGDIE